MDKTHPPLFLGQEVELHIDRLSYGGGRGVSRCEGLVVFTPFTAPGDTIRAQITKIKKKFAEAKLLEVLHPSPHRISPPCPVFGHCGGCQWQHIEASQQLTQKQQFIEHSLRSLCTSNQILKPIISGVNQYRYRNRIQVHKQKKNLGFYATQSHDLNNIEDCLISDEQLTAKFKDIKTQPDGRYEIGLTTEGDIFVTTNNSLASPAQFSQVNTEINTELLGWARKKITSSNATGLLDLYCGSGNFVESLPEAGNMIYHGIELNERSVEQANEKYKTANHLHFSAEDVAHYLQNQNSISQRSVVIVDPPRKGLSSEVIQELKRLSPPTILYVSCHLQTLKRDLQELKGLYTILEVQGFDMFPQTDHIETACHLTLRDA